MPVMYPVMTDRKDPDAVTLTDMETQNIYEVWNKDGSGVLLEEQARSWFCSGGGIRSILGGEVMARR